MKQEDLTKTFMVILLIIHTLEVEVVSRYRDPQLQVTENLCDLQNLGPTYISVSRLKVYFTLNILQCRMSTVVDISALRAI